MIAPDRARVGGALHDDAVGGAGTRSQARQADGGHRDGQRWEVELTEAFRETRLAMYALARRTAGDEAAADITQDVFVRVWQRPERFDSDRGTLRQYLLMMTRGVAIDHLRRDVARRARELKDSRGSVDSTSEEDDRGLDQSATRRLAAALARLNDGERQAIAAAYFDEMTHRDVAVRMGIPEGTAKSRIRLGMSKLRADFDVDGNTGVLVG